MKTPLKSKSRAFTLVETVVAIGVLAVLLTGFVIVFAPAAAGIKRSINVQEADRLASTLEQELVTSRPGDPTPGFTKGFQWIRQSNVADTALMIYQYRGSLSSRRTDGTPVPVPEAATQVVGRDFAVLSMVRRKNDSRFLEDLAAVEGSVYTVKCTQLVFVGGELRPGTAGEIKNPKPNTTPPDPNYQAGPFTNPDEYPEAVIAFSAEFHALPSKAPGYFGASFAGAFAKLRNPVFTRNLAVRR